MGGLRKGIQGVHTFLMRYARVLTIAGSDSGGGAGIQADIKAISATGGFAASAITAITAQNTLGVRAIHEVPLGMISAQIDAVLEDIGADAVKIGMLSSAAVVRTVRDALERHGVRNIVLDPVMVATSGDVLLEESAVSVLRNELAPYARVLTPNIPEAELLMGRWISSASALRRTAADLSHAMEDISGRKVSVLMKAGHLDGNDMTDYFYNAEEGHTIELHSQKTDTVNTHGTGCTLSSAFASYLAQGQALDEAAASAKRYLTRALEAGAAYTVGSGHGPVCHFFDLKRG